MSDVDALDRLQAALRLFREERYEEVVAGLEGFEEADAGGAAFALRLASEGSILEAQGRAGDAMESMERALAHGAYLPDVLARLADYFSRHERPMLAQHAFLLNDTLAPRSMSRFVNDRPAEERARYAPWMLRSSHAARLEDLYGLVRHKQALVERLGPDGAALTLAGMLMPPGQGVARRRPLTFLQDHVREHGTDVRVLIEGGPTASTPTPRFEGEPSPPVKRAMRSVYTAMIENVVVTSKSSFLLTPDRILLDVTAAELEGRRIDLSVDPLVVTGEPEMLTYVEHADRDALRRIPEAISLCGTDSRAFGHWIMQFLPRVWALMDVQGFEEIPILIDQRMPEQHRHSLAFFLGPRHPLIVVRSGERVIVDDLWVSSAPAYLPIGPVSSEPDRLHSGVDDAAFDALLDRVRPRIRTIERRDGPRRIYLSRKGSQHRQLTNASDVEATLAAHGFVSFDFGDLSFERQLGLLRGADVIVAAGGSATLLSIFAEPGLKLAVLMPPMLSDMGWITQAARAVGIELIAIAGEVTQEHERYRWLSDYEIDIDQLDRYLAGIDAS